MPRAEPPEVELFWACGCPRWDGIESKFSRPDMRFAAAQMRARILADLSLPLEARQLTSEMLDTIIAAPFSRFTMALGYAGAGVLLVTAGVLILVFAKEQDVSLTGFITGAVCLAVAIVWTYAVYKRRRLVNELQQAEQTLRQQLEGRAG
jgi:hypothetical protein